MIIILITIIIITIRTIIIKSFTKVHFKWSSKWKVIRRSYNNNNNNNNNYHAIIGENHIETSKHVLYCKIFHEPTVHISSNII